jgi:hypothetical protein
MTWTVVDAWKLGHPFQAHCTRCGTLWERPVWDPQAVSLPVFITVHDCLVVPVPA